MRRLYPGHKAYGLGKLCAIYGIELGDHHRALCDARAAAKLLNLINRKRTDETQFRRKIWLPKRQFEFQMDLRIQSSCPCLSCRLL
jgi:DNA polymerase III alpha subunit (gram-positive type)